MEKDKETTPVQQETREDERTREGVALRERGKALIIRSGRNAKQMNEGIRLLQQAFENGDPEAAFILGKLTYEGYLVPRGEDPMERAKMMLACASEMGSLQARVFLNEICLKKYEEDFQTQKDSAAPHPLVDFDGEEIKIDKCGIRYPVDAKLEFDGTENHLQFSLNLFFENMALVKDPEQFRKAVVEGIKAWEGTYTVFGGQKLKVSVEVTMLDRSADSVHVYLMNEETMGILERFIKILSFDQKLNAFQNTERILRSKNSFALIGRKWKVTTKKTMAILQEEGDADAYRQMVDKTKHEFGHVLGLGDLYKDSAQGLGGVDKGEYLELDDFHVHKSLYQLVMCTSHGVISNNDIEMIVLAFRDNALQVYQKQRGIQKVSEALGKGN